MTLRPFFLGLALCSAGCGQDIGLDIAQATWRTLQDAGLLEGVVAPGALSEHLRRVPGPCLKAGQVGASMVHTETWEEEPGAETRGQATAHVAYALSECQAAHGVALSGAFKRSHHGARVQGGQATFHDAFFGHLEVGDRGTCRIDALRLHSCAGATQEVQWQGSICGYPALQVAEVTQ